MAHNLSVLAKKQGTHIFKDVTKENNSRVILLMNAYYTHSFHTFCMALLIFLHAFLYSSAILGILCING